MQTAALKIENKKGLHARAAAKFVKCAADYPDTEIHVCAVERDGGKEVVRVLATSMLGLLMLAAEKGSTVYLEAVGNNADQALGALAALVEDKFQEGE